MGARETFHPFRGLLRDGQEAFGGLIVLIPTVSTVACGVAGSRTSAFTLPLPEEVSSRLPPGEERGQLPAAARGCARVSETAAAHSGLPLSPGACSPAPGAPRQGAQSPRAPSRRGRRDGGGWPHPEEKASLQPARGRGAAGASGAPGRGGSRARRPSEGRPAPARVPDAPRVAWSEARSRLQLLFQPKACSTVGATETQSGGEPCPAAPGHAAP